MVILKRVIVSPAVYPCFLEIAELTWSLCHSYLSDQYVFRPTGSTTAALIALFHTVCNMLSTNNFVHVIALDFSKSFDSVCHITHMR